MVVSYSPGSWLRVCGVCVCGSCSPGCNRAGDERDSWFPSLPMTTKQDSLRLLIRCSSRYPLLWQSLELTVRLES